MRTNRAPDASHRGIPPISPSLQQRVAENIIRPVGLGCLGPTPERRPARYNTTHCALDAQKKRGSLPLRVVIPTLKSEKEPPCINSCRTIQAQPRAWTVSYVCIKVFFYFLIFYYYFMIIFTYKNRRGWKGSSHTLKKILKKNETREMVRRGILSHTVAFFLFWLLPAGSFPVEIRITGWRLM